MESLAWLATLLVAVLVARAVHLLRAIDGTEARLAAILGLQDGAFVGLIVWTYRLVGVPLMPVAFGAPVLGAIAMVWNARRTSPAVRSQYLTEGFIAMAVVCLVVEAAARTVAG